MPDAHSPWPTPQDVLLIVNNVRSNVQEVTLDEIDGEFYWFCCRVDLLEPIRSFRGQYASFSDPIPTYTSPAAQLLYLRYALAWATRAREVFDELYDSYPWRLFERLFTGGRVPVRVPEVINRWEEEGPVCRVRVYSGTTTGIEVEQAFVETMRVFGGSEWGRERFATELDDWTLSPEGIPRTAYGRILEQRAGDANAVCLSKFVEFHLVEGPEYSAEQAPVRFPYVEVVIHRPVPQPGSIARDYDQVVREEKQWQLRLPGGGTTQEKEVAVRTWAVGLLIGQGVKFGEAMRQVCHEMDTPEVSQACFTSDRRRLFERVPEARSYLFARKEPSASLAKAD